MADHEDVIDIILSGKDDQSSPEIQKLNCIIYRNSADADLDNLDDLKICTQNPLQISKENVSVNILNSKIKIRVKLAKKLKKHISIKYIADIAIESILNALQEEIE